MRKHLLAIGLVVLALIGVVVLGLSGTLTSIVVGLAATTALIMGGTGNPLPASAYVQAIGSLYLSGDTPVGVTTPEQFWPVTGLTSETFDQSVSQGVTDLNTAITTTTGTEVVFGYSQSATISTIEMQNLEQRKAEGLSVPTPSQLSFVLVGDPNNPNGGILERFAGLYIPILDVAFNGATPNTQYPTTVYTIEYDGWADFPEYPLDLIADLNAIAGIIYLHPDYPSLTAAQLATAILEPTTPGSTTTYYLIPTENLPLLQPLVDLGVPAPIIALIQPTLTVLVSLGYDRNSPANVPTPAQLINPNINLITLAGELVAAAQQGITAALADLGVSTPPTIATQSPQTAAAAKVSDAAVVSSQPVVTSQPAITSQPDPPARPKATPANDPQPTNVAVSTTAATQLKTTDNGLPTAKQRQPVSNTSTPSSALSANPRMRGPIASNPSQGKGVTPSVSSGSHKH